MRNGRIFRFLSSSKTENPLPGGSVGGRKKLDGTQNV